MKKLLLTLAIIMSCGVGVFVVLIAQEGEEAVSGAEAATPEVQPQKRGGGRSF